MSPSKQGDRVGAERAACPGAPQCLSAPGLISACTPPPLPASSGTYHQQKHVGFALGPLLWLREEIERGLPCPVAGNGSPGPAASTGAAWSRRCPPSPWSQDPHKPPSWVPLLCHPRHPHQLSPGSLYLGSRCSPPPWEVNSYPQPHFKAFHRLQWHVTKFASFLSLSDPWSAPAGVLHTGLGLFQGSGPAGGPRPGWVWDCAGLAPLFTSCLWGLTLEDPDGILEVGVPTVERAQGLAKYSPSMAVVQRGGWLPGGRTAAPLVPKHCPSSALGFRGIPDL